MTLENSTSLQRTNKQELAALGQEVKSGARWVLGATAILWLLELFDLFVMRGGLDRYGIRPRSIEGLVGIATAPFLHGGMTHLIANTIPFVMLGGLIMLRSKREWFAASIGTSIIGGLAVWLIGASNSVHIGASGVIFGYFGYLLSIGIFERKISSILLSLFVGITYGTMIFGFIPVPGVSWEGHLFGFIGGIISAWLLHGKNRKKRKLLTA